MPVWPPGDITVLDTFTRADDTVYAGAGATLWSEETLTGAPSTLVVSSGKLVSTLEGGGGLTLESEADAIRIFTVSLAASSGYLMFFFRMDAGDGYALAIAGGTVTLYEVTGGTTFTEVDVEVMSNSLSSGVRVGIRFEDDEMSMHLGSALYMNPVPEVEFTGLTNTSAGACGFQSTGVWGLDNYASGSLIAPTSAVTIHVDPDHVAASDEYTRLQASDPDTPLITVQRAGWLVRADVGWADTILVNRCETAVISPSAPDTHVQPPLDYRSTERAVDAVGWPLGDNAGNEPVVVLGNVAIDLDTGTVEDVKTVPLPTLKFIGVRGLNNWQFKRLQVGYDAGSGDDHSTPSSFERVTDIEWSLCRFTGGFGTVQHWTDAFNVRKCVVHSALPPPGISGGLHPGGGFRMEQSPGEGDPTPSIGQLLIDQCEFSVIEGDDAIALGGLYDPDDEDPVDLASDFVIRDTLFHNVAEGNPVFHTDSIQAFSVRRLEVDGCVFIGCSNALQVTDYRNGFMRVTRCLTVGLDVPFQIQGVDEFEFLHNTCIHVQAPYDLTMLFYTRAILPEPTLATIQNNIIGGFWMRDGDAINDYFREGSVIENNIVLSDPGLETDFGVNLDGLPEFGNSARLDDLPTTTVTIGDVEPNWELSTVPVSPGTGEGAATDVTADLFDRAYTDPPDVGCLQSDPGTVVVATDRPPYLVSRSPAINAVGVSVTAPLVVTFYPVPGFGIDPETVTADSVYLRGPNGVHLPVNELTVTDVGAGRFAITLIIDGEFLPAVVYAATLTTDVADENDNHLRDPITWSFRAVGFVGAEMYPLGGLFAQWSVGVVA